jgi:hypothetical protein
LGKRKSKAQRGTFLPILMVTIKDRESKCGKGLKTFVCFGGNISWCSHYGKQSGDSSKTLEVESPFMSQKSHFGVYTPQ